MEDNKMIREAQCFHIQLLHLQKKQDYHLLQSKQSTATGPLNNMH